MTLRACPKKLLSRTPNTDGGVIIQTPHEFSFGKKRAANIDLRTLCYEHPQDMLDIIQHHVNKNNTSHKHYNHKTPKDSGI